ncbi:hypothetical protein AVEN_258425-1 [Araneus ventricosus]|uniref:Uncharacterized protein n=1 Tax=Araneus ventricosus TaxID=182803 RepID=A0A4Y2DGI1_ARAVE|nr:hypothetical protein AVEN_258425-1 [Araneus ventricosus]
MERPAASLKLRSISLSFHELRPWFALFPVVGTGRIDVACGLVSASVASRVMVLPDATFSSEPDFSPSPRPQTYGLRPSRGSILRTLFSPPTEKNGLIKGEAAFLRPVFPRVPSAVRVIPHRRNRKNGSGLWACICCFPSYGGKKLARQRRWKWPDGINVTFYSRAAERFDKPRVDVTERLVGIPPTTVHKYESRATRGFTKPHTIGTSLYLL